MDSRLSPDTLRSVTKPETSYVIAASPRSGSNLLCEALWLTGRAGRPEEYFIVWHLAAHEPERLKSEFVKPWLVPPARFLEKMLEKGTTPNGVFGVKIMWGYFDIVIDNIRTIPRYRDLSPSEVLKAVFPNLRYVYMTRRDKVRQAVSMAKAMQSRKWVDLDHWVVEETNEYLWDTGRIKAHLKTVDAEKLEYDFDQIARLESELRKQDVAWQAYFAEAGIESYRIVYEEFVDSYEQTALDTLEFLGIPRPAEVARRRRAMKKQTDSVNEEWTQRFKEDLAKRSG